MIFFAGIVGLLILPLPQLQKNIYFDENALLTNDPGYDISLLIA
jgi:hypothetical protein